MLEVLHGRRFPKKSFLLAFIEACGVDPATDTRWERTWNRLSELVRVPGSTASVDTVDDSVDTVDVDLLEAADDTAEPALPAEIWEQAQELLQQARASADREARKVIAAAQAEANRILDRARTEATAIRSGAERAAEQILLTARDRAEREAAELKETILADLATELDDELEQHRSAARTPGSGPTDKRTSKEPEQPQADGRSGRRGWFGRT